MTRLGIAIGLGIASVLCIVWLGNICTFSDVLGMPGFFLGSVIAPGGIHDGHVLLWYSSFMLGNLSFYTYIWWVGVGRVMRNRRSAL